MASLVAGNEVVGAVVDAAPVVAVDAAVWGRSVCEIRRGRRERGTYKKVPLSFLLMRYLLICSPY